MALRICSCQRRASSWRHALTAFTSSSSKKLPVERQAKKRRSARFVDLRQRWIMRGVGEGIMEHAAGIAACGIAREIRFDGAAHSAMSSTSRATPPSRPLGPPSIYALEQLTNRRLRGESGKIGARWRYKFRIGHYRTATAPDVPARGRRVTSTLLGTVVRPTPNMSTQASFGRQPLARL